MALNTISTSFIEEFESGVHVAYQRMGSKLRNTVRTRNGVKNKTTFQKIGKGFATTKARHGNVAPMNLAHTNVSVTVELLTPIAMDKGLKFAIREGGKTVGAGVVAEIIE